MKVLEFQLPQDSPGLARADIIVAVEQRADRHGFDYSFNTQSEMFYIKVSELAAAILTLTWTDDHPNYTLVSE